MLLLKLLKKPILTKLKMPTENLLLSIIQRITLLLMLRKNLLMLVWLMRWLWRKRGIFATKVSFKNLKNRPILCSTVKWVKIVWRTDKKKRCVLKVPRITKVWWETFTQNQVTMKAWTESRQNLLLRNCSRIMAST